MSVYAYLRVSTAQQADSGLGLEAQRAACERWAERQGVAVDAWFSDEGISGTTAPSKRPALLDALGAVAKGDVLLVAKLDRLARDPFIAVTIERTIERRGASIVSAAGEGTESNDPGQVLMRRMIGAFAEYEALVIAARTRAALRAKAARGEHTGGEARLGQRVGADGVHVQADGAEISAARDAQRLRAWGWSLRRIGAELQRIGHRPRGKKFHAETVKKLLAVSLEASA